MNGEPRVTLVVSLMRDGVVQVNGPLHDKILCYGLLAAARDAVHSYEGPPKPQIEVVPAGTIPTKRDGDG